MEPTGLYKRVQLQPLPGDAWILINPFTYYVGTKDSDHPINIEAGFSFDGASIPRIFHIISTPMGTDTLIAAMIHDKIFNTPELRKRYTLQEANDIFYEVMIVCGVNKAKAIALYLGLSVGSGHVRKKKTTQK